MHCPHLPPPSQDTAPAFVDPASARTWIATQPQTQPLHMLVALRQQIEAIDGASLPPARILELLTLLHKAALPLLAASETRFFRKALPMQRADQECFEHSVQLWLKLGIAYLRCSLQLPKETSLLLLQRAVNALRMAQYCHFQAGQECPPVFEDLLLDILTASSATGVLLESTTDPDFPQLGPANLAGIIAWTLLLKLAQPYQLSAQQLLVANRALRRWREQTIFLNTPDSSPRAQNVALGRIFNKPIPEGVPSWLEIRKISRKIRQRIEALQAGESPEILKLGRELSGTACIRLLQQLETSLDQKQESEPSQSGTIQLSFGGEHAYAIFTGQTLNTVPSETRKSSISHQRMAIFGFDTPSSLPGKVKQPETPAETWTLLNGMAQRVPEQNSQRRASPCLIVDQQTKPRLGVMRGIRQSLDGTLKAKLQWHTERVEAGFLVPPERKEADNSTRQPAFVLHDGDRPAIILPSSIASASGKTIKFEGNSPRQLLLGEVIERGIDFVRYAIA